MAYLAPTVKAWKICDREIIKDWSNGHCTLLGDAAHAMVSMLSLVFYICTHIVSTGHDFGSGVQSGPYFFITVIV